MTNKGEVNMENWVVVQRDKESGEEKLFLDGTGWHVSKRAAELAAQIRKEIVSDKYEVFIRQTDT